MDCIYISFILFCSENMSNLLTDIKGISAEDILPLASEERDTEPIENGVGVFFSQFEILKCEISYVSIFTAYNENCFLVS